MNFTRNYKFFLFFSASIVIVCLAALVFWGLKFGIDFAGGSLLEADFARPVSSQEIADKISGSGFGAAVVQPVTETRVSIKLPLIDSEQGRLSLKNSLTENFGEFTELRFDSIGPAIGKELRSNAVWQIVLVNIGILLYIAYAFRRVKAAQGTKHTNPWHLSLAAIVALIHDILILLGSFAFLGRFHNVEIDSLFITAVLTVLGFSIHDTIVVFDRLRENLQKNLGLDFAGTLNYSLNQTLTRSINTSMIVLLVLLALALFGGQSIYYFVLALIIGIVAGTYSSIFVASGLLMLWHKR